MNNNHLGAPYRRRSESDVVYSIDDRGTRIAIIPLTQGKTAKLDAEDWERIHPIYGAHWCLNSDGRDHQYARTHVPGAPKGKNGRNLTTLQRVVLGALPGERTGFINGDTLDCRKCNVTFLHQHYDRSEYPKSKAIPETSAANDNAALEAIRA